MSLQVPEVMRDLCLPTFIYQISKAQICDPRHAWGEVERKTESARGGLLDGMCIETTWRWRPLEAGGGREVQQQGNFDDQKGQGLSGDTVRHRA